MNRKFLEELGLEKEAIDSIMAEHGKAIQAVKPAEDYEELKTNNATLKQQLDDLQSTLDSHKDELNSVEDLKKQVESYKLKDIKTNIAVQAGIPLELAGRLSGETEEEIKEDAEKIAGLVTKKQPLPLKPNEPEVNNEKREMEQMQEQLTGKH